MLELLRPNMYVESIFAIDREHLWKIGIRGLIFDLDNTIIPWKAQHLPPDTATWLTALRERGFKLCVVSNAKTKRVEALTRPLNIPAVPIAIKPSRRAFLLAMTAMETKNEETAVVGDQLFTDVLGGNRLKLFTILVRPMSSREFVGTKFMRVLEKLVLGRIVPKTHNKENG